MLELLSPAGSMDALRAAVQNGADAVYLGAGDLNARRNARNFSPDDLREAVTYCHVRGVKVHLTLNILTADRQMPQAAALIRHAANLGVDAFIVQDLGVVSLCRQIAPEVPIHASTQMSLHSLEGVRAAADLGCARAVLARRSPGPAKFPRSLSTWMTKGERVTLSIRPLSGSFQVPVRVWEAYSGWKVIMAGWFAGAVITPSASLTRGGHTSSVRG